MRRARGARQAWPRAVKSGTSGRPCDTALHCLPTQQLCRKSPFHRSGAGITSKQWSRITLMFRWVYHIILMKNTAWRGVVVNLMAMNLKRRSVKKFLTTGIILGMASCCLLLFIWYCLSSTFTTTNSPRAANTNIMHPAIHRSSACETR